mgnify:CR=1 FL=1
MNSMKELFSDVLQTVMEAELEEKLGYEKSEHVSDKTEKGMSKNYRNGYSKKTVKTQLGEVDVKIPRDRNGEYELLFIMSVVLVNCWLFTNSFSSSFDVFSIIKTLPFRFFLDLSLVWSEVLYSVLHKIYWGLNRHHLNVLPILCGFFAFQIELWWFGFRPFSCLVSNFELFWIWCPFWNPDGTTVKPHWFCKISARKYQVGLIVNDIWYSIRPRQA